MNVIMLALLFGSPGASINIEVDGNVNLGMIVLWGPRFAPT